MGLEFCVYAHVSTCVYERENWGFLRRKCFLKAIGGWVGGWWVVVVFSLNFEGKSGSSKGTGEGVLIKVDHAGFGNKETTRPVSIITDLSSLVTPTSKRNNGINFFD